MFRNCKTIEELKKAYRQAAIRLHPDNGGDVKEFQKMQEAFSIRFEQVKNIHTNKDGETYERTGEHATKETAEDFMSIIDELLKLAGIEVELCGTWVWVSGNTKEHKDRLKELGLKYSSNKKMWYYQTDGRRRYHKKAWSIDEIRNAYGSQSFSRKESDRLTATA